MATSGYTHVVNLPQGDVNIYPVSAESPRQFQKPTSTKRVGKRKKIVLAFGEVTGHAHRVTGDAVLVARSGEADNIISAEQATELERWLEVGPSGAVVEHEEHAPVKLEEGTYFIPGRQREYAPGRRMMFAAD